MDEEIERLVVSVRADTQAFARDVDTMRGALEGPFKSGVARVGQALESALTRAITTGKLSLEDLKRLALQVTSEIASAAIRAGIGALGGSGSDGGLFSSAISALGGSFGVPGRATGGPVSPGRAYMVGERGPELFVPTASGQVVPGGGGGRDVRVNIAVQGRGNESEARLLARSARQVARAVRGALQ